ncbi:lipopolysaccharide biosynthesis protein [Winogradskyella pacifica]|uniref:lipopolysaccharide biosynthesis protein n=1 Tax=Winogradskyella pacifica TaxID=664642 RepID=UPI0015CA2BD2|nr:lipopolysaccharide biosynthesis protein [Winogradskyella pacifica]
MSLKKRALSGVVWTALQKFANQIIGFIISIILARLLLPEEFGLIAMLTVFIALGSTFINSGLSESIIRTENPDDRDFSTVFYFNLIVSLIVYIIIVLAAPYISDFYQQDKLTLIIRVYALDFVINAFAAIQSARLTKKMDFKALMLISTPSLIISGTVGVLMALYGFGVWSLVWSKLAQSTAFTLQLWFKSKWRPLWLFSKEKFKVHFNFGYKFMLSGILNTLFDNAYVLIIGKFFSPAQVGFFSKANGLRILPVHLIGGIFNKITFPLLSEIQNDESRLKNVYSRVMQMVIFIVAPTLIFVAVLGEPIFRFLYTDKWLPAVPYFQILCIAGVLHPIQSYNLQILKVKGRTDLLLKAEVIKKIMTTIVIVIAFQYGIYGLVYASVVSAFIAVFVNTHYTNKLINYSLLEQIKDVLPTILLALFAGFIMYFTDTIFGKQNYHDLMRIVVGGVIGVLIFILGAFLFRIKSVEELKTIILRK